jgi:hypothetical protein
MPLRRSLDRLCPTQHPRTVGASRQRAMAARACDAEEATDVVLDQFKRTVTQALSTIELRVERIDGVDRATLPSA